MDNVLLATDILIETIRNGTTHQDYKRVTDLAAMYLPLFTGEGIDALMRQFVKREDPVLFQQRKDIYQSVMPSVTENISNMFRKPLRSNHVFASIDFKRDKRKEDEVRDAVMAFWQGENDMGLDAYLQARWFDLVRFDPNAFQAVSYDAFDPDREKAKPYPVEFSSKEAVNFSYTRGAQLDWLIIKQPLKYKIYVNNGGQTGLNRQIGEADGFRYIMYIDNDAIVMTEVHPKDRLTDIPNPVFQWVGTKSKKDAQDRLFVIQIFNHKAGRVPAVRVGYKYDPITNGRTCLSILHAAVPFYKKEIKAGSELDLTMALHTFPQKIQYAPVCEGDPDRGIDPCRNGLDVNGNTCPACKGTGIGKVHTTAQDVILIPLPRQGEDMIDLDKVMVYKGPDVGLVRFQDEYVDKLTDKAQKAVFGGLSIVQKESTKTATEMDYAMDGVFDTLQPFTKKYSFLWVWNVTMIAIYTDNATTTDRVAYHRFPNTFKYKSNQQLFEERKAAADAGVPNHIMDALDIDIQEAVYSDDQDTLEKIKVKARFMPFSGKSTEEVEWIISSGKTTSYYTTLYNHFEIIFEEIDNEIGDVFYIQSYELQQREIKKRVARIQAEIQADSTPKINIIQQAQQEQDENDTETVQGS